MNRIDLIEKIICKRENIDPAELHQRVRLFKVVEARKLVMYYARKRKLTLKEIGCFFDLDHASVLHAVRTVDDLRSFDKDFRGKLEWYDLFFDALSGVEESMDFTELLAPVCEEIKNLENRIAVMKLALNEIKT